MPFHYCKKLIDFCDQSALEDRAKMVEFYLHNMALTNMNFWDPNAELGDLQLMALASWMNHEESRAAEMKKYWPERKTNLFLLDLNNQMPWP